MPGSDRTGPLGQGPMTGRGLGYCGRPGTRGGIFAGRYAGRYGGGRGWRHRFWRSAGPGWFGSWDAVQSPVSEFERLRAERDYLRDALEDLNRRLENLEKQDQGG